MSQSINRQNQSMQAANQSLNQSAGLALKFQHIETTMAQFQFLCDRESKCYQIKIGIPPFDGPRSGLGYLIEDVPPALQLVLSPQSLKSRQVDNIAEAIGGSIKDYRGRFGDDGHLKISSLHTSAISERINLGNHEVSLVTWHSLDGDYFDWAELGFILRSETTTRNEKGSISTIRFTHGEYSDKQQFRKVSVTKPNCKPIQFNEIVALDDFESPSEIAASTSYARDLFAAFGPDRVIEYLSCSLSVQAKFVRQAPLKIVCNLTSISDQESLIELLAEARASKPRENIEEPLTSQRDKQSKIASKPKSDSPALLDRLKLYTGVVIERYDSRSQGIVVRAWNSEDAPSLVIGKNTVSLTSFFDKGRIERAYRNICLPDEESQINALVQLQRKGFAFKFSSPVNLPQSAILNALIGESTCYSSIKVLDKSNPRLDQIRTMELLRGREVVCFDHCAYQGESFSRLRVMLGRESPGFVAFDGPNSRAVMFLMPNFNFSEDPDASLTKYLNGVLHSFSESPAQAIDCLIMDTNVLSYPSFIEHGASEPAKIWMYGIAGPPVWDIFDFRAVNTVLAIYSLNLSQFGAELTPLDTVLSLHNTSLDHNFNFMISFRNGLGLEVFVDGYGIVGASAVHAATRQVFKNHYSSNSAQAFREFEPTIPDSLGYTLDMVKRMIQRGSSIRRSQIESQGAQLVAELFGH